MILRVVNHKFHYEMENLCRVFFPYETIRVINDESDETDDITVVTSMSGEYVVGVSVNINGTTGEKKKTVADYDDCEREMAILLFSLLSEITGYVPKWGILTGVRPSKLMNSLIKDYGDNGAKAYFTDKLLVCKNKTELAYSVAKAEEKIMSLSDEKSFSLYVSIPFCPTRCNYCSFVSHSIAQAKKLLPDYVENLCKEIKQTAEIANGLGLRLESIYWGGGTPTTLSAEMLERICAEINNDFDLSHLREYTIEAGRADTVTAEKLRVIKAAGVGRISINPQTFNDDVLKAIGRRHTVDDVVRVFNEARELGFDNINMDLIAGLTDDTYESFCNSIDRAISMNPENITLHTLALKRSSTIVTHGVDVQSGEIANKMLEYAQNRFYSDGYKPYYMYRQKYMAGNLENTGYAKKGKACVYNIDVMEEIADNPACGANAVSKRFFPSEDRITRYGSPKDIATYIAKIDKIISDKEEFFG